MVKLSKALFMTSSDSMSRVMGIRDMLMAEETLFKNQEAFDLEYVPENFIHRESQLKSIAFCIRPALQGGRPVNARVYGPPATGKTTAVKLMFEEVENTSDRVVTVHVNCQIHASKFTVFSHIHRRIFGHLPPETGVPFPKVYDRIFKRLVKENKSLIVALDDMNYLFYDRYANEIIYDILRAHEVFPGAKTAIFGVLSEPEFNHRLDLKVSSIFKPQDIFFQPYNFDEMFDILKNRAMVGLYPGVISDEVLKSVTGYAFSQGDLRVGIELLRVSALLAEEDSKRAIEHHHVEKAFGKSRLVSLVQVLKSLGNEERFVVGTIAELGAKDINSGELYESHKKNHALSYTKFYRILEKLEAVRIVDARFTTKGQKGRTRNIIIRYEPEEVEKALNMIR